MDLEEMFIDEEDEKKRELKQKKSFPLLVFL